jgi:hypothetical protein
MRLLLTIMLLSAPLPAQEADRLTQLHEGYISRHDAISADHDKAVESLKSGYLGALTRLKDRLQRTGSLETVTPVVDEYAIVREHTWPLPDLNPTAPRELKSLRETYAKSIQSLETKRARELVDIADKMTAALKTQETELTKAGNLESAQLAKHMRESLEKDEGIANARDFLEAKSGSKNAAEWQPLIDAAMTVHQKGLWEVAWLSKSDPANKPFMPLMEILKNERLKPDRVLIAIPNSVVEFKTDKNITQIRGKMTLKASNGSVLFKVIANDKVVLEKIIRGEVAEHPFDVQFPATKSIRLETDSIENDAGDWSAWIDPEIR